MRLIVVAGLAGLAALLAGGVFLEYQGRHSEDAKLTPSSSRPVAAVQAGVAAAPADRSQEWAATLLARPMFSPARRPPAAVSTAGAAPLPGLPRLSAILVSDGARSAIFAGPPDGKPIVAAEGSLLGRYRVQSIGIEQVTVLGPDGTQVIRPSFAAAAPTAGAGLPPPAVMSDTGKPSILDQLRRRMNPSVSVPGLAIASPPESVPPVSAAVPGSSR